MPKTTKRAATKRAAKIARAHATELPKLDVKEEGKRRDPGYKPPARGIARYPWATFFVVLIIAAAVGSLYLYHLGPFAPPAKPKTKTTTTAAVSPCLKLVSQLTDTSAAPTAAQFDKIQHTYSKAPAMTINTKKVYCAGINTNRGLIVLELDPSLAPNTVNNFVFLAQHQYFDGMVFHRVVPGFVIQTGDPTAKGSGGPGYKFNDEPVKGSYTKGCVAMANSGANTNGSQFFICTGNDTTLPKSYNLFGHVVQGIDVASKIQGPGDTAASKNIKPDVVNHVLVVAAS